MRHATRHNKRDANEPAILATLAQLLVSWTEAPPLDGWIFLGQWIPVEIKNPEGLNKLRPSQVKFIEECQRLDRPHLIWRSEQDAINTVNLYRSLS